MAEKFREVALTGHSLSHRMLRVSEAARARDGAEAVDALYTEWGRRFFTDDAVPGDQVLVECLGVCGLDADHVEAADNEQWDVPIAEAMEIAYEFGGPKTQTPTIVVFDVPPHGFKGPIMAAAPTGPAAVRLWDAIQVISEAPGFFELTRPRTTMAPLPHWVQSREPDAHDTDLQHVDEEPFTAMSLFERDPPLPI